MKPPFKPANTRLPARTEAGSGAKPEAKRPGFPVQLKPLATTPLPVQSRQTLNFQMPSAIKKIATQPVNTRVSDLFHSKTLSQSGPQHPVPSGVGLDSHAVRTRMVQKLAAGGISDAQVLAAMGQIERHRFVDSALVNQAYEDTSLPIGLGQTISKPNVVARMLSLLRFGVDGKLGRVLEIGTGCGYQAAVLSQLATEVYSIERLRGLHDKARDKLRALRLPNVHLLFGDGMLGYAQGAPYAAIIAAAGGEAIPQTWIDQLAIGGRLVAPVHAIGGAQALVVVDKTAQGVTQTLLEAVHFVPLKSGTL